MLFDTRPIGTDFLISPAIEEQRLSVFMLRLDAIHEVVSGNKLFKLQFFLEQALSSTEKTIITFGGAYSNHLVATAYACQQLGLRSIGLVRGEKPSHLSHTLQYCSSLQMELHYLSRSDYQEQANTGTTAFKGTVVPEGGYHPIGAKGAANIMQLFPQLAPTHIITATGTGTTLAGLLMNKKEGQTIIAVPVIKGMHDLNERLQHLLSSSILPTFEVWPDAHEGGYAKHNPELISWMNQFYEQYQIPTDVIYTAKMMKAVFQKIEEKYFEPGSCICCIHTGGLQGNQSFAKDSFVF